MVVAVFDGLVPRAATILVRSAIEGEWTHRSSKSLDPTVLLALELVLLLSLERLFSNRKEESKPPLLLFTELSLVLLRKKFRDNLRRLLFRELVEMSIILLLFEGKDLGDNGALSSKP